MSKFSEQTNFWDLPIEGPNFVNGQTRYDAAMFTRLHQIVATQTQGALDSLGEGVVATSTTAGRVSAGVGLNVTIEALMAIARHEVYGPAILRQQATTWPIPASSVRYLYLVWSYTNSFESWRGGVGTLELQSSDTFDAGGADKAGVLLAKITSGVSTIAGIEDRRVMVGQMAGDGLQAARKFKAGPVGGPDANAIYRYIEVSDIPNLPTSKITNFAAEVQAAVNYSSAAPVDDIAALRAVAPADRANNQQRVSNDNGYTYTFNSTATGTDDGENIITPTTGTGRWFKTGGGGTSDASTLQGHSGGYYLDLANSTGSIGVEQIANFADEAGIAAAAFITDTFLATGSDLEMVEVTPGNFVAKLVPTGVIAGTYTNPTITYDEQGRATAIEDGDPPTANATQIQGVDVSETEPEDGQIMGFSGGEWGPVDAPSGGGGGSGTRPILTTDKTFYVSSATGSDSNAGTSGSPFLTLQKAVDAVAQIDKSIYQPYIQLADGTYDAPVDLKSTVGALPPIIQGNSGTPSNVLVKNSSGSTFVANGSMDWILKDMKIESDTGFCIDARAGAYIQFGNLVFGDAESGGHVYAVNNSKIAAIGDYEVVGGAIRHVWIERGASAIISLRNITFTGTPVITADVYYASMCASVELYNNNFSGSCLGKQYRVERNAALATYGGLSSIPGTTPGDYAEGGWVG